MTGAINPITEADNVVHGLMAADIAHAAFIGTSRGGVIAMILAAMRPGLLKCVALNDVGPQVDARGLLRIKSYVEKGRDFADWQSAVAAVRAIGQLQFPDLDDKEWAGQARLIFEGRDGTIARRFDPAIMNTLKSLDTEGPLPNMWPQFAGLTALPVMAIHGENSDLLSAATLTKMAEAHPGLNIVNVPRQGHAPDLGSAGLPAKIAKFIAQAVSRAA